MKQRVVIGTRGSKLALWQAEYIASRLKRHYPELTVEIQHIVTSGDKILDVPLAKIGGKGLFTKELELAMLNGEIDLAVHSLKDVPTELPTGLCLTAVTARQDPGDALVSLNYSSIDALPHQAKVGTSSLRRTAQLLNYRPDLEIESVRGNLDTRLKKLDEGKFDAVILAAAGLKRLGWEDRIRQILPEEVCLPAVGQGALAIETRENDREIRDLLAFLQDEATEIAVTAERAFLAKVGGGCQVPVGVKGSLTPQGLFLEAVIASLDGKTIIRQTRQGTKQSALELGRELAEEMLAVGGREILEAIGIREGD